MIETIKLVGSIVGLLVGVFTAWDRLVRGRPLASLAMTGVPTNAYTSIRVKNISAIDILITDITVRPKQFRVAKDHSLRGIIKASIGDELLAILSPGEEKDFPFFAQPSVSDEDPNRRVHVFVYWRKSNSTWIKQIPKLICTSTKDIEKMAKGL
jgi:hypothetical protein